MINQYKGESKSMILYNTVQDGGSTGTGSGRRNDVALGSYTDYFRNGDLIDFLPTEGLECTSCQSRHYPSGGRCTGNFSLSNYILLD